VGDDRRKGRIGRDEGGEGGVREKRIGRNEDDEGSGGSRDKRKRKVVRSWRRGRGRTRTVLKRSTKGREGEGQPWKRVEKSTDWQMRPIFLPGCDNRDHRDSRKGLKKVPR